MKASTKLAGLSIASAIFLAGPAIAQVAGGSTTMGVTVTESTKITTGWSVKKTLMGKSIYNEQGKRVGRIDDLIISPDKKLSYVIVGAGGFVGIGRHDVAIPVTQIQDQAGKLIMAGATKDSIKAMPQFVYLADTSRRDEVIAAAEKDIALGNEKIKALEARGGELASEAKVKMGQDITAMKLDVKAVENRVSEMKQATASNWKRFEANVNAATARLRKSIDSAKA